MATAFPATASQAQTTLTLASLGSIVLRQSDDDKLKRWGGAVLRDQTGTPVADLQRALTAVGVYTGTADGQFGPGTMLSVRRFQWFVINARYRLMTPASAAPMAGTIAQYPANPRMLVNGQCDAATASELGDWVAGNFRTTTLLVRTRIAQFGNITRAATFTTLAYPQATDDEVLVNGNFGGLGVLDGVARTQGVQLRLNQTFRVQGVAPRGAVVPPATRSQHLIGHAIDLNIVVAGAVIISSQFTARTAPKEATDFVTAAKAAGLRWGGDFGTTDPPHYDNPVTGREEYDMNFFFCQRSYTAQHPMRLIGA